MAGARPRIVALVSLGCPKNLVDSERMLAGLALAGFAVSGDPDGADVAVVNTCAFIDLARAEADKAIAELERLKRAGRLGRIIVAGCMAQREGKALLERHPGVDGVAGLAQRDRLADLCRSLLEKRSAGAVVRVEPCPASAPDDRERLRLTPRHYAYLRITEGCDNRCSYCAIPEIRGPLRSKPPDAVLAEAGELTADGARELVLVGQDTTAYGRDRPGAGWTLARVLARLRAEAGAEWIRLMYTHPASFGEDVIEELARGLPIVPYVDLPIQHASDRILESMGRRVTRADIERLVGRLREAVAGIALRTTFIVGYPGETEAEFEACVHLARKVRFDHAGVFMYSPESGTRAAALPDPVPTEVRRERWERLMGVCEEIAQESARGMVGRTLEVRVDGAAREAGYLAARHAGQAPEVDSAVLVKRQGSARRAKAGDELTVRVTTAKGYDIAAEAIGPGRGDARP